MNRDQERAIEWDVFQIHNRMYILGDAGDHEGYANSFTEDGVSVYEGIALNGRAEILQSRFDSYEPRFYRSFVANCTVTVIDEKKTSKPFPTSNSFITIGTRSKMARSQPSNPMHWSATTTNLCSQTRVGRLSTATSPSCSAGHRQH